MRDLIEKYRALQSDALKMKDKNPYSDYTATFDAILDDLLEDIEKVFSERWAVEDELIEFDEWANEKLTYVDGLWYWVEDEGGDQPLATAQVFEMMRKDSAFKEKQNENNKI